jgi:hypothetical protein
MDFYWYEGFKGEYEKLISKKSYKAIVQEIINCFFAKSKQG